MKNQVKKSHANQAYQLYYHGMMLPGFIFLILFNFVPMFGAIMAFQDYRPAKGFFGSDFVGLKHFKYLFEMPDSFELFRNTLIIALGKIVLTTIMSIAFAILLNEVKNRTLKKSVQTVVYLPHFLSWVVLALVVKNLFNLDGSVNAMLGTSLNWLGSNSLFQPLLILTDTWKEFGYGSIVYLAAITSIDSTLYEAASIDGATWWKKVWHVTLPGIRTTIVLMAVIWLAGGNGIAFEHIPASVTQVVGTDAAHHVHPRLFPHISGMSDIAFLAGILLLFAGVEVHAVHAPELKRPQSQFPRAMFLAALISFSLFTLGALAVAVITPYEQIDLQAGLFVTFRIVFDHYRIGWMTNVMGLLVTFGALAGILSWISGPSRGLLWTAREGRLPRVLGKTNRNGVQINILLIQGALVTLLSSLYIVMKNVNVAFFLLSALTIGLYLIMYMMMYAAAIRLRYTQPDLPRSYRVPGGRAGIWIIAGGGLLAVLFSFAVTFFPPSQLPVGSPATYTALVASGTLLFLAIPFAISRSMDRQERQKGKR